MEKFHTGKSVWKAVRHCDPAWELPTENMPIYYIWTPGSSSLDLKIQRFFFVIFSSCWQLTQWNWINSGHRASPATAHTWAQSWGQCLLPANLESLFWVFKVANAPGIFGQMTIFWYYKWLYVYIGLVVRLISLLLLCFKTLFHNMIVWNRTFKIFHHKPNSLELQSK